MSDEIPSFLGITPFGPYCRVCNLSLSIHTGILTHGKEVHPDCPFKNAAVVRLVNHRMDILRNLHAHDLSIFLKKDVVKQATWFCTVCFTVFSRRDNYDRHLARRGNACSGSLGGKMQCYVTICGRVGPKSCGTVIATSTSTLISQGNTVSTLTKNSTQSSINKSLVVATDSKVPTTLLITEATAVGILSPFVRPDEDARDLCMIYYPLLAPGFEGKMKEFLSYSACQPAEDGILFKWLEAGREWLGKYAAGHIANVSANVRSRLAEFEHRELDGPSRTTFTLRRGIGRLMNDLDAVLRFFYRYPTTLFDYYKSSDVLNSTKEWMIESAIVPKILFTAVVEEPEDHGKLPVACLYCLSQGFTMKGGYDLAMNECGWFASKISALLHLLRAGVCGYLVTLSGDTDSILTMQEMEIVGSIQNCRVTNLLAPYIKRLRDLNAKKPLKKDNTVNGNGDITSGGYTFPHAVWSTIIPRLVAIAQACFEEIFEHQRWKSFMVNPINMVDWIRLEAFVMDNNACIRLSDLKVKSDVEPVLGRLQSVAELCFLGLGVGAVRHEEVIRLTVSSCQWHNSYLYFWSESLKRGSLKAKSTPKLVEHRLSLSLSKVFLLIRYAMTTSSRFDGNVLFPNNPDASMLGLMQDIFDMDYQPQYLNARHLFTSIGNVVMPENGARGSNGCFVSMPSLTEKSGHTQQTGRQAYGTWLEKSDEIMYDRYHSHIGEDIMDPPTVDFTPYSETILKASLKELMGRKAVYRSEDQKLMIDIAVNSVARHSFVGLPCGHGKSLSWMVPTMASYLSGRHVGLRIVILPYKFLLGHIVQHSIAMLGLLQEKLPVAFLCSSDIEKDSLPDELAGNDLPSLLFLNLDGAALLLRFHLARLQSLAKQNILKRLYVDEFQQLVVEYGFRQSYQCLRDLGRIGVPVMCLSGSLPFSIAMPLMSYCGLTQTLEGDSLDIVKLSDPVGDGFSFDVSVVKDVASAIIDFVLESRVGACHVLCSSVSMVETVTTALSTKLKVLSITGESSYHEQIRCAKSWLKGEHDVLVSTVVGLVGNENKFCKTIVVGGFLFNVSSLVQAIGRLRPAQRGPDSKVHVFRHRFRSDDGLENSRKSDALFHEMCEAGCLNESDRDVFMKIFAPVGLQRLLSMKEGCYIQEMSRYFGYTRIRCDRCWLCSRYGTSSSFDQSPASPLANNIMDTRPQPIVHVASAPIVNPYKKRGVGIGDGGDAAKKSRVTPVDNVALSQTVAEDASTVSRQLSRKVKWVFCELLYRCLVCGTVDCNGELCLKGCYRCGDRNHQNNVCSFNNAKFSKILANKGVCFGCFDTRQHTMEHHEIFQCPYKRRLRRLLFLDRERKGMSCFETYLRKLYASELSYISVVAYYARDTSLGRVWMTPRRDATRLECMQVKHDTPEAPLLPPDVIQNSSDISCDGSSRSTRFKDVVKARCEYNRLRSEKLSCRRQRLFVFGAVYESFFPGYFEVNPMLSNYDLVVTLDSQKDSMIQIRLVSPEDGVGKTNLLASMVELGRSLSGPGNARGFRVGDIGSMHAIGLKNASSNDVYVTSENTMKKAATASVAMREWLEDNMRDVLTELVQTDSHLKVKYPTSLPRGPGSRMMMSVNLANSPHLDSGDTSKSIAIWVEERPGKSKNWYFVLPNVSYKGSQGLVIKLVHGVVISWDGREIFHCSSRPSEGEGNRVYGCMWGCSRKERSKTDSF